MQAVHYIYFSLLYLAIILFTIKVKSLDTSQVIIFIYLVVLAVFSTAAMVLRLVYHVKNNLFLFHILTPVEYLLLSCIYFFYLKSITMKRLIALSMVLFVVVAVLLDRWVEKPEVNNSYIRVTESLLITGWILFYFRQMMQKRLSEDFYAMPVFWISVALLFYFIGTLFIQGLLNYMIQHGSEVALKLYYAGYIFEYLLFILVIVALYCHDRYKKQRAAANPENSTFK
jgi:hypothetical protein